MEPSQRTATAAKARDKAEGQRDAAITELHAAIVADLGAGVRQADLARLTGYSRERIRQIEHAARSGE